MKMTRRQSSNDDTMTDGFNMLLRSAHLQQSLEPRPIHREVERQLRALSHRSILSSPETEYILDRAVPSILRAAEDTRLGATDGSLHPRKKQKVFQENPTMQCTSTPQTKTIRREETPEHPGLEKLTSQSDTRKLVTVKHADGPRASCQDKLYCDDSSVWERKMVTLPSDVIPTDTLQGVSKNTSQAAVSCGNEHDAAITMVADATPPEIGHENYDTDDLPDPHSDTNTKYAAPPAPWLSRNLLEIMRKSEHSQSQLEDWDEDHGLPKSHCLTMVSSSRSRRQLQQGVILPKWDGTPLISQNVELGKPRKRRRSVTTQPSLVEIHRNSHV
jgi:hypothetical protein